MGTTDYIGTPYPETTNIGDVPKQMKDIAYSWEEVFGGVWNDFTPYITQGVSGVALTITLDLTTSICRYRKIGKTVFIAAHIDVSTGTGASAYPIIYLPLPMANAYIPAGLITSKIGAAAFTTLGRNYGYTGASSFFSNPSQIAAFDQPTARVAADWFELLLRYETV